MGRPRPVELVRSNAEILKRVLTENDVDYNDDYFTFDDVTIEPKPVGGRVPFWYCGATPALGPAAPSSSATAGCRAGSRWRPSPSAIDDMRELADEQGKRDADGRGDPADVGRGDPRGGARARQHPRPAGLGQQGEVRGQAAVGPLRDGRGPRGSADRRQPRRGGRRSAASSRRSASSTWSSTSASSSTGSSSRSSCWARRCCRIFEDESSTVVASAAAQTSPSAEPTRLETDSMGHVDGARGCLLRNSYRSGTE